IQPHDPDFVPEPIYPEYIPLEDEHILPTEEQPLPPVVSPTVESPGHEVGESSTRGRGVDYGFVDTVEAEMRHQDIREVGVTELDELHEHDTQYLYALLKDAQDEEEAYAAREAWAHSIGLSQTVHHELQTLHMRREMDDMYTELLALRGQPRRAGQPGGDARVPNYQDAPRDADRNEGVVGLSRWIEKMESVFNISGCVIENQVKFATCTLLDAALTWWNGQIRTLGLEAFAMTWEVLKKKMTDKYCPQGEVKKLEIELWNLKVKGNDVPTYTNCFQELTLICTKFVANENEKIDKNFAPIRKGLTTKERLMIRPGATMDINNNPSRNRMSPRSIIWRRESENHMKDLCPSAQSANVITMARVLRSATNATRKIPKEMVVSNAELQDISREIDQS
nr:reverse transcriptase domain-containing protein [Tanacetum cinerariifolium]